MKQETVLRYVDTLLNYAHE